MSKIEKALRKAQLAGMQRAVSPRAEASASTALVSTSERRTLLPATSRSSALSAIAKMHEPFLLVPDELSKRGIIHSDMPEGGAVKAFREVRTKIIQKSQGRNAIIMVTAPIPDPQTSLVTLNLSAAFALDAARTALMVDCNFRQRTLSDIVHAGEARGLSDYLVEDNCDVGAVIHNVGIQRLRVVPAGTQSDLSTEAFTTARMRRLVEDLYGRYPERYVILDAPPLTEPADTQILAELCDFILVVIPYGRVTASGAAEVLKGLDPKKIVGMVLNGEPCLPQAAVFPGAFPVLDWIETVRSRLAQILSYIPKAFRTGGKAG